MDPRSQQLRKLLTSGDCYLLVFTVIGERHGGITMRKTMLFPLLMILALTAFAGCATKEVRTTEVSKPVVERQVIVEKPAPGYVYYVPAY